MIIVGSLGGGSDDKKPTASSFTSTQAPTSTQIAEPDNARRPDRAILLAVDGLVPGPSDQDSDALLRAAETSARQALSEQPVDQLLPCPPCCSAMPRCRTLRRRAARTARRLGSSPS